MNRFDLFVERKSFLFGFVDLFLDVILEPGLTLDKKVYGQKTKYSSKNCKQQEKIGTHVANVAY